MNLQEHYETLYNESIAKIKSGNIQTDDLIDSAADNRSGITLRIRPDTNLTKRILDFPEQLRQVDPAQYYYRESDVHVTVMSIISCYTGFDLQRIAIPDYIRVIKQSIAGKTIAIRFTGITASPSCIILRGFPEDDTLNIIRNNLRTNFKNSDLEQSIDKRYAIQTAHTTVVRFRKPIARLNEYLKILEIYRDYDFGTLYTNTLELVHNDWYHRTERTNQLYTFKL
ncbi:2'-5' RNA ligase family protein [Ohtaekwangia kribbensis]|jgi:2'-5' RNA ligase|uniref:2'-5' RNA ligase family protein n=1 Tax=Ohtaekwangia kribbensis TaxID=688913 RepID=A0ABW3KBM5_9BACT